VSQLSPSMDDTLKRIKAAFGSSDLVAYQDLLAPDVTWGPPNAKSPGCKNRKQVLAWYERSRESGVEARLLDAVIIGHCIVLELQVAGTEAAMERGGVGLRWQVNTIKEGRITEIVGFDDREQADSYAQSK
jgi:hypothetical protein